MKRTIEAYVEGEVVLIKAKIKHTHIGKEGKVTYTVSDLFDQDYKNKFTDKDVFPLPESELIKEEPTEPAEEEPKAEQ